MNVSVSLDDFFHFVEILIAPSRDLKSKRPITLLFIISTNKKVEFNFSKSIIKIEKKHKYYGGNIGVPIS